jgi:hypothetical protein
MLIDEWIALGARAKLVAAGLCNGDVDVDRGEPTTDDALPRANIFIPLDTATPEGDGRTGITRLEHKTTLVIEVTARGNTQRAVKAWLAAVAEVTMAVLLSDREWATDADGDPVIEGFGTVRRVYEFPPEGNHIVGRVQVQIEVLTRSHWTADPDALPNFAALNVGVDLTGDGEADLGATIPLPTD